MKALERTTTLKIDYCPSTTRTTTRSQEGTPKIPGTLCQVASIAAPKAIFGPTRGTFGSRIHSQFWSINGHGYRPIQANVGWSKIWVLRWRGANDALVFSCIR